MQMQKVNRGSWTSQETLKKVILKKLIILAKERGDNDGGNHINGIKRKNKDEKPVGLTQFAKKAKQDISSEIRSDLIKKHVDKRDNIPRVRYYMLILDNCSGFITFTTFSDFYSFGS